MRSTRTPWHAGRHCALPLLTLLAVPLQGHAATDDALTLRASLSSQYDSNIFRQAHAASEQINASTLGLGLKTRQSLQTLYANVNLVDNRYQTFSYLNYTATNYDAAWQFAITPRLQGTLASSWQESLNSYTDVKNTAVRYLNSTRSTRLDANYDLDGSWSISAGVGQGLQNNQRDQVQGSDFSSVSSNLGLGYTWASGSKLSWNTQLSSGEYLDQPATPNAFSDDSFHQTDSEVRLHWMLSGVQAVDVYVTDRSVTHPHVAARNFSGTLWGLSTGWSLSGKTSVSAGWSRDLGTYQTLDANYSQSDRMVLGMDWQPLTKLGVALRYDTSHITYLGGPIPQLQSRRQDDVNNTTLSVTWTPRTQCTVSAAVQGSTRSSNTAGLDFASQLTSLTATFTF